MLLHISLVLLIAVTQNDAFMSYLSNMPNGNKIPSCGISMIGHGSSGNLNNFGKDYAALGGYWRSLCMLDSDGDGKTNGEELGDPSCVWAPGKTPSRTTNIQNPAVRNC